MPLIEKIDHLVITTNCPERCLAFYKAIGFACRDTGGRYELFAGDFKINVHVRGRELSPHAQHVKPGSADLCFVLSDPAAFEALLAQNGIPTQLGPVARTGARGPMQSIYLRDPDGNLLEFCWYG